MSDEVKKEYLPAKIRQEQFDNLERVANDFTEICTQNNESPITMLRRAGAMQSLRESLTDEIMAPIMALRGSPLGFKTDKDFSKEKDANGQRKMGVGYPMEVVRDTVIYAFGIGARMTNNEINIIASNPYPTKNFFSRKLDEILGTENWRLIHEVPRVIRQDGRVTGAIVKTKVWWKDSSCPPEGKTQELEHGIKGDDYATTDSYNGKADRKCGNWLLSNITERRYVDGEVDDAIDIKATSTTAKSKFESTSELNIGNAIKDAEVVHDVKPPEITKETIVQMLKEANAPVSFADIEAYMRQNENLPYTVNLENNQLKMNMVYNGLNSIVNKTLTWLENQKK